ncbi:hypothetical protein TNCV_4578001 [Trichonephila clavipes]|nr:hypothetical protein TNCV_4578001 [Trichonephila clavipes]
MSWKDDFKSSFDTKVSLTHSLHCFSNNKFLVSVQTRLAVALAASPLTNKSTLTDDKNDSVIIPLAKKDRSDFIRLLKGHARIKDLWITRAPFLARKSALQIFLTLIFKEQMPGGYIQQDYAPCHYYSRVRSYLNAEVPVWIGRL